jgi:hypothetical protein
MSISIDLVCASRLHTVWPVLLLDFSRGGERYETQADRVSSQTHDDFGRSSCKVTSLICIGVTVHRHQRDINPVVTPRTTVCLNGKLCLH